MMVFKNKPSTKEMWEVYQEILEDLETLEEKYYDVDTIGEKFRIYDEIEDTKNDVKLLEVYFALLN